MKLRLRFALTTAAIVVPTIGGLGLIAASVRERSSEEYLASLTRQFMDHEQRAACEADPGAWVGRPHDDPRPSPSLFAVDERLTPRHAGAPRLDASLVAALARDHTMGARRFDDGPRRVVEVLVPMPWREGPCAHVLTIAPSAPKSLGLPPLRFWALPVLVIFAVMSLAMGPLVHRIRLLTQAVKRAADAGYEGRIAVGGNDEIGELASAFEAAAREVRARLAEKEERERALREFVGNTTHDVMIPLTVLQGNLAALARSATAGEPADSARVTSAMTEVHYMASLIHNLGVAAKLAAGEREIVRAGVDMNALIGRVASRHATIAERLAVSLEHATPETPVVVQGDVTMLEQAVSNVVHNAVRYNKAGGHVAVVLDAGAGGGFRLRVADDGPGIAPEELSRLTERGYRGSAARTRAPDGQGLGLDIAFRVARAHGMRLALRPSELGGLEAELTGNAS
jgi:two-component system, OmpR family, sensor histidine kinase BaeS